jgi:hypothetical protein
MRYPQLLAAVVLMVSFGAAQACPESGSNQTKSTTTEKPLAPKPSA